MAHEGIEQYRQRLIGIGKIPNSGERNKAYIELAAEVGASGPGRDMRPGERDAAYIRNINHALQTATMIHTSKSASQLTMRKDNMWLPKDERRLLTIFCRAAGKYRKMARSPTDQRMYDLGDLVKVFRAKDYKRASDKLGDIYDIDRQRPFGGDDEPSEKDTEKWMEKYKEFLDYMPIMKAAIDTLAERKLIESSRHRHDSRPIGIKLTIDGYDLGSKYSRFLTRTGEWWKEYKGHWLWIIIGYIVSLIVAFMAGRLTN